MAKMNPEPVMRRFMQKISDRFPSVTGQQLKQYLGQIIQVHSIFSIVISLVCIVIFPILFSQAADMVENLLLNISQETDQIAVSIRQASLIFDEGTQAIEVSVLSIRSIEGSIKDTKPLINSTAELLEETAPLIIEDTRNALITAKEGARTVDQVLRNLAKFWLLTGVSYSPEQSLDEGIQEVIESLDPLPAAFREVGGEITNTNSNLNEVGKSLSAVGDKMNRFAEDLSENNLLLEDLAMDIDKVSFETGRAGDKIGPFAVGLTLFFELLLIGKIISYLALFCLGKDIAHKYRQSSTD
jgi:methyl-accepting chemotaxis protein